MNVGADFFKRLFGKKINIKHGNVSFKLNLTYVGNRLDEVQHALDAQVWADIKQYMPYDSGVLIEQTEKLNNGLYGEVYFYDPDIPYAHYMYEGIVYVDPIYMTGAFYSPDYGFWSRPGVEKIPSPSGKTFKYTSPNAVAHWGEVAYNNHRKQWVDFAKKEFKKG